MFSYIYHITYVLAYLEDKFLEVELLVQRIHAFKISMNIAKLLPLEKSCTNRHSQPQWTTA